VRDAPEHILLVTAEPEELGRREPGEGPVARQPYELGETDPGFDLGALLGRTLVVPQDRGAQDAALIVEDDEPVHLAGEADAGHLSAAKPAERRLRGAPPVLRILLSPARLRRRQRVRLLRARQDLAGR
jgi:hypothetical protein